MAGKRNHTHTDGPQVFTADRTVREATDIETAYWAGKVRQNRWRREKSAIKCAKRQKVTLPQLKCLKKDNSNES